MTLKDKLYEILENAYKFNRNPEDTCEEIMLAIDKYNLEVWNKLSRTPINAGICVDIDKYKENL